MSRPLAPGPRLLLEPARPSSGPGWSRHRRTRTSSARPAEKVRLAEALDGPTCRRFADLARRLGIHLLLGSLTRKARSRPVVITRASCSARRRGPGDLPQDPTCSMWTCPRWCAIVNRTRSSRVSGRWSPRPRSAGSGCRSATTCGSGTSTADWCGTVPRILCVPAAFTLTTGRDHWEPLLRRAGDREPGLRAGPTDGRHEDPGPRESFGHWHGRGPVGARYSGGPQRAGPGPGGDRP